VLDDIGDVGPAGPPRAAVDRHGTRPAHADPAGEAVGERRIGIALHPGDHVKHGLAFAQGHREPLIVTVLPSAPDQHLDGRAGRLRRLRTRWHAFPFRLRLTWPAAHQRTVTVTRWTTLLPNPPLSQGASSG